MSYTVTLTDGTVLTTIADATVDNTSSLTLIGRNYPGYGQYIANDLVHVLENFSNTTSPPNPLTGQFWYDSTTELMNIYDGTSWNPIAPDSEAPINLDNPSAPANERLWTISIANSGLLQFQALNDNLTVRNTVLELDGANNLLIGNMTVGGVLSGTLPNPSLVSSIALTGVPTAPTASFGTNTTQIATTAFVEVIASQTVGGDLTGAMPDPTIKASVGLTGVPTAPTASFGTNTTQIATTAFVQNSLQSGASIGFPLKAVMNITSASATATFTADIIAVQTTLAGTTFCLPSFSEIINLALTGAGGMDTGSAPVSGFVALYAIYNPTAPATALLAVNATSGVVPNIYGGAHMPAGYTASSLVSVWPTNSSSQFVVGYQRDRRVNLVPLLIINTGSATPITTLSFASFGPMNAIRLYGYSLSQSSAQGAWQLSLYATAQSVGLWSASFGVLAGEGTSSPFTVDISTPQTTFYSIVGTGGSPDCDITLTAYEF